MIRSKAHALAFGASLVFAASLALGFGVSEVFAAVLVGFSVFGGPFHLKLSA
jgi:hypothetical protein